MQKTKIKYIEGRKVTPNKQVKGYWDVWGVGRDSGHVVYTGKLNEIKRVLKV